MKKIQNISHLNPQSEEYKTLIAKKKEMLIKMIIVGSSVVGKSCLLQRYTTNEFNSETQTTVGIEFSPQTILYEDILMKINIMDTAGQEKFQSLGNFYYRNAAGALLVYDLTSQESFDNIQGWLDELREGAGEDIIIMLVGNKMDLQENRVVDYQTAANFAQENDLGYIETSAKTGKNVKRAFNTLIDDNEQKESVIEGIGGKPGRNQGMTSYNYNNTLKLGKKPSKKQIDRSKKKCC